jgi:hypothetical protein
MLCKNKYCGIVIISDFNTEDNGNDSSVGELCQGCKKNKDLTDILKEKEIEHMNSVSHNYDTTTENIHMTCYSCLEIKRLKECIRCENCLNLTHDHRLCHNCKFHTKQCSCGKRTLNNLFKYCPSCIPSKEVCAHVDCDNVLADLDSWCCEYHSCSRTTCANPVTEMRGGTGLCMECVCKYTSCKKMNLDNSNFCQYHECKNCHGYCDVSNSSLGYCRSCQCRYCYDKKIDGHDYCIKHMCFVEECYEGSCRDPNTGNRLSNFCEKHICKFCPERRLLNHTVCKKHICKLCDDIVAKLDEEKDSEYCNEHKCIEKSCPYSKLNNRTRCMYHTCIVEDCEEVVSGDKMLCDSHGSDPVCGCVTGYNFYLHCSPLLTISRALAQLKTSINWKFAWTVIKASKKASIKRFREALMNTCKTMLVILHRNGVPKDIRKLMFYDYYLPATIEEYFKEECVDCLTICNDKCEGIGWPHSRTCKTHVCWTEGCNILKDTKESNYCKKHTCGDIMCHKEIYKDKGLCGIHLCPLCRQYGTAPGLHICQKCQCNYTYPETKKIDNNNNEIIFVRCLNPKMNGSDKCDLHTIE